MKEKDSSSTDIYSKNTAWQVDQMICLEGNMVEKLIAWIELAFVLLLGVLYLVPMQDFPEDVQFRPMHWLVCTYAVFALIKLFLIYRGCLSSKLVYFSVAINSLLVLAILWSFHLHYVQPPAFSMRAPAFFYFFIFISLTALRCDMKLLVLSGSTAVLGYLSLLTYSLMQANSSITDDFIEYLNTNSILIATEVEKMLGLIELCIILMILVYRFKMMMRKAFVQSCPGSMGSFYPGIASKVVSSSRLNPGLGGSGQATVLVLDLRNFTRFAVKKEAPELLQLLQDYQRRMISLILSHGGTVDKLMGDSILAHFGFKEDSGSSRKALEAMEALSRDFDEWMDERQAKGQVLLDVGMACAYGEIVFGLHNHSNKSDFVLLGQAVNLTDKLERHSKDKSLRAITTKETFERALQEGYEEKSQQILPQELVKNLAAPLDLVIICKSKTRGL